MFPTGQYMLLFMKNRHNKKFDKQLIIYLLSVLSIIFGLISVTMFSSLKQFINNNAYTQSKNIADNILQTFAQQISSTELVPTSIFELCEKIDETNSSTLPAKVLKSFSQLSGCSIHYDTVNYHVSRKKHICAHRRANGSIIRYAPEKYSDYLPDSSFNKQKNERGGYWKTSTMDEHSALSYCEPILDKHHNPIGILKLDFCTKNITDIISKYKLFSSGYLFITDHEGNFITYPGTGDVEDESIHTFFDNPDLDNSNIINRFVNGESGSVNILKNNIHYYLYFTKIPTMNWRLAIVCPYSEIMLSVNKLYVLLFICFSFGLIFLFISIIQIVKRFSYPLRELATAARHIANGQFDIELKTPSSNDEIKELYDAFKYLQQNLSSQLEQKKLSMIEKEKLDSEMKLAQKIQQRFLPTHINLPPTVELYGELKQSKVVGGDLYEYFIIGKKLYFAIGDVSGHGTPAALYMASIIKLFRYVASSKTSTAEICNIINNHMCDNADDDMYITMFMGIIELDTGMTTFTNAGHPYPIIINADGETSLLDRYPDVPIGVLEDHFYSEHIFAFRPGTQLLLYTDGITDAEDINAQFYGKEKIMKCIRQTEVRSPYNIVNTILVDIHRHIQNNRQSDDLTILSILYKGHGKMELEE